MKLFSKIHIFALALIASAAALIGAGDTLCGDLSTYTYHVPMDSKVRVYFTESEVFVPTSAGEFKIYLDHYGLWSFFYAVDINDIVPAYLLESGIRPVSVDFGMKIDVSWDTGFNSPTNLPLDPSFKFVRDASYLEINGTLPSGSNFAPYKINYNQYGNDYGSNWERNLVNAPYRFMFDFSCDVSSLTSFADQSSYFSTWISAFQYGNVSGDDVSSDGYGLIFTVQDFYITFSYIDESLQQSLDDIQGAITSTDVDDEGGGDALEDVKDKIEIQVPDSLPVEDQFNALNSFMGIAADEVVDFFGAVVQPIYITVAGYRFDLMQLFLGFLGFFLLFGLVFLVLKGSHNTGGKDD